MDVAEVRVGTRRGKRERITVVGVQRLRFFEGVVRRGDAMGVSSLLVQVTVAPAFTVKVCGVKVKLWISTAPLEEVCALATRTPPARPEPTIAPKMAAAITDRIIIFLSLAWSGIVDHERPFCWLEANTNAASKEKTEQLFSAASCS
jgi:hypothetical protein